jgi:phage tail-like protein
VTDLRAVPHLQGRRIVLTWRNPPATDFTGSAPLAGVRIVRRQRTFPRTHEDGDTVYNDGPVISTFTDGGLQPLTTYFYTVFAVDAAAPPNYYADTQAQAAALATENYNLAERLYKMLPAVHQRYDLPLSAAELQELQQLDPAVVRALAALPSRLRDRGQLWRFFHAAAPLDLMRSLAEGLRHLHNVDLARPEFLSLLGRWLGWDLDRTLPVFAQRNEIRFAPRLYRSMGTIPNLRTIVHHYTGWHTQVAEFAQHIARANQPPQLNLFAIVEDAGAWRGADDAAPLLGFDAAHSTASGSEDGPAILVSTTSGLFALRPNVELAVTADDRLPVAVLFRPGDFADMARATAGEVAAVLNRTLSEVTATALDDGRIELRSHTLDPDSALRVERSAASLVTLEGAPRGRLATCVDVDVPPGQDRCWVFYETFDPLAQVTVQAATQALRGESFSSGLLPGESQPAPTVTVGAAPLFLASQPQRCVRYKALRRGTWGASYALEPASDSTTGDPAACQLPNGRIFVAWLEHPNTAVARLRWQLGIVHDPQPARLVGQRNTPFAITPGSHLVLRGNWPEAEGFEFAAGDFVNPQQATAEDIAAALNARLSRVKAVVQPNQTLVLETVAASGDERLEIDLQASSAAQALGFGAENAVATGAWGDVMDWSPPQDVTAAAPGRHADLYALVDAASGVSGVRLFWATHVGTHWHIVTARWDGEAWSGLETRADSLGGNREPCAVLDTDGRIWLFWARRQGVGTPEDIWTLRRQVFDPATTRWSAEAEVTTPPVGRAADREPGVVRLPCGDLRVFFRSDRAGGADLWSVTVKPSTAAVTVPEAVTAGYVGNHAPAPILLANGALWLLHRSDRSVSLSRVATRPLPTVDNRLTSPAPRRPERSPGVLYSVRSPDIGTLERFAGTTSVVLTHTARGGRRGQWDDLLAYTPQRLLTLDRGARYAPGEEEEGLAAPAPHTPLEPNRYEIWRRDDRYTRGTVGLFLSPVVPKNALFQQQVERLRPVLERFLPSNVRAIVILTPRLDIEFVYQPGADIEETYADEHPEIEFYSGLGESAAAALPDWLRLLATTLGHVSADPADLTTLRRRTYFPPPQ